MHLSAAKMAGQGAVQDMQPAPDRLPLSDGAARLRSCDAAGSDSVDFPCEAHQMTRPSNSAGIEGCGPCAPAEQENESCQETAEGAQTQLSSRPRNGDTSDGFPLDSNSACSSAIGRGVPAGMGGCSKQVALSQPYPMVTLVRFAVVGSTKRQS